MGYGNDGLHLANGALHCATAGCFVRFPGLAGRAGRFDGHCTAAVSASPTVSFEELALTRPISVPSGSRWSRPVFGMGLRIRAIAGAT